MANFPASTVSGEYLARVVGVEAANQRYLIDRMRRLPGLANGLTSVLKRNAYIKGEVIKPVTEVVKQVKKSTKLLDELKKTLDTVFKKVPGGNTTRGASKVRDMLGILIGFGGIAFLMTLKNNLDEELNRITNNNIDRINQNISDVLRTVGIVNDRVKDNDKKITKLDERLKKTDIEAYAATIKSQAARDKANDALYEVRQGRKILEGEITEAKKQANDALYETRKGREKLQDQIDKINKDLGKYLTGVKDNFQERIDTTLKGIVKSLDKNTDKIVEHNKAIITLQDTLKVVDKVVKGLPKIIPTTKDLEDFATKLINTKIQPIEKDAKKALTTAEDIQKNGVTKKEYDGTITSLRTTYDKSFEAVGAKWNEQFRAAQGKIGEITKVVTSSDFVSSDSKITKDIATLTKTVEKNKTDLEKKAAQDKSDLEKKINDTKATLGTLGTLDKKINDTRSDLEKKIGSVPTIDPAEIDKIKRDNDQNKKDVKDLIPRIKEVEEGIKEQKKVNDSAIPKLDDILKALPLIPGRAADAIKPSIPTKDDIKQATGQAICSSLNGGCSGQANADLANNINNNTNNRAGDILGAVNAAENTAQIGMLTDIQNRLGPQLPDGGVSGFLGRFFEKFNKVAQWLHLDRALNILIWWQTLHNAYMLSANLGQTLTSAISNVLAAIGIKDAEGSPLDIGQILGSQFDSLAKSVIGESEWGGIKAEYKKWNRIYQAAANLLNSIQSIGYSILSALEVVGSWVASIGNALRKWGEVGETAYRWMNPTPNFQNKFFTTLENANNVVSQVDQIAGEVLSVQDTVNQIGEQKTEIEKALKEDEGSKQGTSPPEAAKVKAAAEASKAVSATGLAISDEDKEADE